MTTTHKINAQGKSQPSETDGTFTPNENAEVLYGEMREPMGGSWFNSGLFESMKRNGTEAMFCGHDHCNDFCAKYEGIYLVYNQTGGYN